MESAVGESWKQDDFLLIALTVSVAVASSFAVFAGCFYWFRREQRRWQKNFLRAMAESGRPSEDVFLTGREAISYGELIAQFKVNDGKQVVSVLESDGRRFIHVVGELSAPERAKMVRYLKSEGFMS